MKSAFDPMCRRCPRLGKFLDAVRLEEPSYFCRPVPPFGDPDARLLIVGLAPGKHGANRTGRPFTGDHAGILLYATLHKFGLASGPVSTAADDGLELSRSARVILALGAIAHAAVLRACDLPSGAHRFAHAAEHPLRGGRLLLDSYHCSRYNTQTRRLTPAMFEGVVARARDLALAARMG